MERLNILPIVLAVASMGAVCAPVEAQTVQDSSANPGKDKPVREVARPMLFSFDAETPGRAHPIEFRTVDQMTRKDRDLAADAEASIGERAGYAGLEFNEGKWSYRQVVCPVMKNHLFLRFMRNNGTGDVSVFSASIPRDGEGRVRIIPIQLRGYSLFSPAPINALTISAFNHIRAEEHPGQAPDWLGTGLCYAALAGGHPQAALSAEVAVGQKYPPAATAELELPERGGAILSFTDVSAAPRPMEWTMTFDRKGRLLKARHSPAALLDVKVLHPAPVDLRGAPVPPAQVKSRPVPNN